MPDLKDDPELIEWIHEYAARNHHTLCGAMKELLLYALRADEYARHPQHYIRDAAA